MSLLVEVEVPETPSTSFHSLQAQSNPSQAKPLYSIAKSEMDAVQQVANWGQHGAILCGIY